MHGPLDNFKIQFLYSNKCVTSNTSDVQKCSIIAIYLNLQIEAQPCLEDQTIKA